MSNIFSLSNLLILPFWLLMIFAPKWRGTQRIMQSPLIILGPALLYLALVLPRIGGIFPVVLQPSLSKVVALLGTEDGATIAWAHFLAFDLFVGRWVYLDSRERDIHPLLIGPILFLVLMLGPIGFLLYLAMRWLWAKRGPVARLWKENPSITFIGLAMVGVLLACCVGLIVDERIITGRPAWLKPAKFAISITIYSFTLLWVLRFISGQERLKRNIAVITATCFAIEMIVLLTQVIRGTSSHFNINTPLDRSLFSIMGFGILPVWILMGITSYLLLRQKGLPASLAATLRWGTLITFVGMGVAVLMLLPSQMPVLYGKFVAAGAHAVGAPDDGPGLPILGWSTTGGDLRVGHFIGLHALQLLPLLYAAIRLLAQRFSLSDRAQTNLTHVSGATYLGITLLVTWQALRAQPIIAPDALTLGVAGTLAILSGSMVFRIILQERNAACRTFKERLGRRQTI